MPSAQVYKIRKWHKLGTKIVDLTWSWENAERVVCVYIYVCVAWIIRSLHSKPIAALH